MIQYFLIESIFPQRDPNLWLWGNWSIIQMIQFIYFFIFFCWSHNFFWCFLFLLWWWFINCMVVLISFMGLSLLYCSVTRSHKWDLIWVFLSVKMPFLSQRSMSCSLSKVTMVPDFFSLLRGCMPKLPVKEQRKSCVTHG